MILPSNLSIPPAALKSIILICLTILAAILLDNIFRSYIKVPKHLDNKHARKYILIFRSLVTGLVYIVAIYSVLVELGVNIAPLLASAGIIGVIIGIGARQIIEDLISGIFLFSQDLISVGDYIKLDDAEGYIETMGFRMLSLRGVDGALYLIPNGQIKRVINFSRRTLHVFVDITIKADQKIDRVQLAMEEALTALREDTTLSTAVREGSTIDGIQNYTADGRMIVRANLITSPAMRDVISRKFRYLVKKKFEEKRLSV